jgi:hypothetical protein
MRGRCRYGAGRYPQADSPAGATPVPGEAIAIAGPAGSRRTCCRNCFRQRAGTVSSDVAGTVSARSGVGSGCAKWNSSWHNCPNTCLNDNNALAPTSGTARGQNAARISDVTSCPSGQIGRAAQSNAPSNDRLWRRRGLQRRNQLLCGFQNALVEFGPR